MANPTDSTQYPAPRSFRLDETARKLLDKLHKKMGVSQADVVRLAIRELARVQGLLPPENHTAPIS